MFNPDETLVTIKNYLTKLTRIINDQATFTWFHTKIVKKTKIDDILCCIEGSFPDEYKNFVKRHGTRDLKGYACYQQLLDMLRGKSMLFSDSYSVKHNEAIKQIQTLTKFLKADFTKVCNSMSDMY